MTARPMYEVAIHGYGRRMIGGGINAPAAGLLEFPQHKWKRITPRPLGLARATALADAQPMHAVVCLWETAEKVFDNGKPPNVPEGWWHPRAQSSLEPRLPMVDD